MIPKKAQKMTSDVDQMESKAKKARRKIQNHCSHNNRRNVDEIVKIYNDGDSIKLRCTICGEDSIPPKPPEVKELKAAIRVVRTAATYVKMRQDAEDEKGEEIVEICGDLLDQADNFQKIYENIEKASGKKKDKRKNASRCAFKV